VNPKHDRQIAITVQKIRPLQERKFFGQVTLDFQGGNILRLVVAESIKLEDIDGSNTEAPQAHGQQDQEASAKA
jgi:hypothetical protein